MEHCPSCGALLVTVPIGAICTHRGFELEDPEEGAVLAFRKAAGRVGERVGFWASDDWPEDVFEEVA